MKKLTAILLCLISIPAFADDWHNEENYSYNTASIKRDTYAGIRLHLNKHIAFGYEEFEDSEPIGNIYFNDLSDIFITESDVPILGIELAPKFENVYFTEYYTDMKAQAEFNEFCRKLEETYKKSDTYFSEEDFRKLQEGGKRIKGIASINKLRKFTPEGIEYSRVSFRSIFGGNEIIDMAVNTIKYDRLSFIEFSTDENLAKMFRDRANEIYNNIINE